MDPCYCVRRSVAVALALVVVASAATAAAQYMYLDANGDGVHTEADVFPSAGSATLDVWLVTDHNRDGSQATCAGDPSTALTINSYSFILRAIQGTVTWSNFQDRLLPTGLAAGGNSTATEFWVGRADAEALAPGRYRLASITVTPTSGTPSLWIVSASETMEAIALTSFGCQCFGNDFDNTMKLGTDWYDADGLPYGAEGDHSPVMAVPAPMTLAEGTVAEQTLHATDADAEPLAFSSPKAPSWVAVTTSDPGAGSATGAVRLTPGLYDAGHLDLVLLVSDGASTSGALLPITVTDVDQAPVMVKPEDMTVEEGKWLTQVVHATDPDGGLLLDINLVSAPSFLRILDRQVVWGAAQATLIAAPGIGETGTYTATIEATDGVHTDAESFQIVVTVANLPPIIADDLGTVQVAAGSLRTMDLSATDPEGAPLSFYKVTGPEYMTVLTVDPGHGTGLGRVELRPSLTDIGGRATIGVSDGSYSADAYLDIEVSSPSGIDAPPVLNPIADMVVVEGDRATQTVMASDPDGTALSFSALSFFPFMTLETVSQGPAYSSARIVLTPHAGDHGWAQVGVQVSDGIHAAEQWFRITVLEPQAGSTMLLLHREPAPSEAWGTLQFRSNEGTFTASGAGGSVVVAFDPPPPRSDGSAWGPAVQLACLPAQRPSCVSDRINNWVLSFTPPLGGAFVPGAYTAAPVADGTNAGLRVEMGYCSSFTPATATVEIRQIQYDASGAIASFWATVRHDPDATSGLFTAEVRYEARLPVSIDAPSRMEAHAGALLEIPLRVGGYAAGAPLLSSPDLPAGASLDVTSDTTALFRWTPAYEDKGLHSIRFIAERPGSAPDTCLMTTCVDIPGEVTAVLDVNQLEALVTNRGAVSDWVRDGPGLFYPRGSGVPVARLAGLVLGGMVDGSVRIAMPTECCDYHPGPIQNGGAVPFEPRFKNYTIRYGGTADFDWVHWPTDLGAPVDRNGAPLLTGGQTIWSLYNDAPAAWEPAPYSTRAALGIEVRQTTWGFSSPDPGDAAFQAFRLRNAGSAEIHGLYAGIYIDPVTYDVAGDVGYPNRGIMGSDSTLGLGYAYGGYFARPNAVGVLLLGPRPAAGIQERRWSYPNTAQQIYSELQGLNPDGTSRHAYDDPSQPVTPFAYTGDPVFQTGWLAPDTWTSSTTFLVSAGPFDLAPGEEQEVTVALIGANGFDRLDAVSRLRRRAAELLKPPVPPPTDRAPVAEAGGPYSGFAGTPVSFDGSGSSDPDGDALIYTWSFGDGTIDNALQSLHTYSDAGVYSVRLSVFDSHFGDEDSTTAQIAPVDSASALLTASGPAVRLQSARPTVRISLEPSQGSFAASDVDLASVTLERADGIGSAIAAVPQKSPGTADADHDGIAEIAVTFRTAAMRTMLADLPPGSNDVAFWIRGSLNGGGRFAAPLRLTIDAGKRGLSVSVAPNPLNPTASLTFRTTKPGPARVLLFDVAGRVVRVAFDEPSTPAGYHEVPIGRDDRGDDLPSGVYFYRVLTPEGSAAGKLVMMK